MGLDDAFIQFDGMWTTTEYDLDVYRGDAEGDPDETAEDRKTELTRSLRNLADAATKLAAALDAESGS